MNKKSAQTTIFVILGLVILFFIGLFIYNNEKIIKGEQSENTDVDFYEVNSYIDSCLRQSTEQTLNIVAINGGYYKNSVNNVKIINFNGTNYSLYYDSDSSINLAPNKSEVLNQIRSGALNEFKTCFNESFLEYKGIFINDDKQYHIEILESEENLIIILNFNITAKYFDESKKFEKSIFQTEKEIFILHDSAVNITEKYISSKGFSLINIYEEIYSNNINRNSVLVSKNFVNYEIIFLDKNGLKFAFAIYKD